MNLNKTDTTMKKIQSITFLLCMAASLISFSACSKEDNNENDKEVAQAVQFGIVEEDFAADIAEFTRVSAPYTEPIMEDVGDCEAEVTVMNEPADNPKTITRAITTPTHYTIRVYEGSTLKGEFKGTFSGVTFTPDAGTPTKIMLARKHTYTFICFNDQVTPNGDKLEVALADAATARIGRRQVTLGTANQAISLSAKHVGVQVNTRIAARVGFPDINATIQSTGNNIPPTGVLQSREWHLHCR